MPRPYSWRNCLVVFAASTLFSVRSEGQLLLSRHEIGFGIAVSVPSTWIVDDGDALSRTRERSLNALRTSGRADLREIADDPQDAMIFAASDPKRRSSSITMNVTVAPESNERYVETSSPQQLEELYSEVCDALDSRLRDLKGTGGCLRYEIQTIAGRKALVISQRTTISGSNIDLLRTMAIVPSQGALLIVGISMNAADNDEAMARVILASLSLNSTRP